MRAESSPDCNDAGLGAGCRGGLVFILGDSLPPTVSGSLLRTSLESLLRRGRTGLSGWRLRRTAQGAASRTEHHRGKECRNLGSSRSNPTPCPADTQGDPGKRGQSRPSRAVGLVTTHTAPEGHPATPFSSELSPRKAAPPGDGSIR